MGIFSIFKKKKTDISEKKEVSGAGKEYSAKRKQELNEKLIHGGENELKRLREKIKQKEELKKEITVNNLEDLKNNLTKDKKEVLICLKESYPKFLSKQFISRKFSNQKELEDYALETIISFLNSMHLDLASRISELRKQGQKISYINLKVMYISSKLRLFKSEMNLKELKNILNSFKDAKFELEKFKDI
jgi:hypothetical protein